MPKHIYLGGGGDNPRITLKGPESHPLVSKLREVESLVGPGEAMRRDLALYVLNKTMGQKGRSEFDAVRHALGDYSADCQQSYAYDSIVPGQLIENPEARRPLAEASTQLLAQVRKAKEILVEKHGALENQNIDQQPVKRRKTLKKIRTAQSYFRVLEATLGKLLKHLNNEPIPDFLPMADKPKPYITKEISASYALVLGLVNEHLHIPLIDYCRTDVSESKAAQLSEACAALHTLLDNYSNSGRSTNDLLDMHKKIPTYVAVIQPILQDMVEKMNERIVEAEGRKDRPEHMLLSDLTLFRDNLDTLTSSLQKSFSTERS